MKSRKVFLSKKISVILLIILVYIDALLDIIRGKEGNPLWIPFVDNFGIYIVLILAPFVILLFYLFIKCLAKIVVKVDKTPFAEEILLTALVVIYGFFDLWLISVDFFGFKLIKNFYYTIPFLIIIGLIYALWAEWMVKKRKKKNDIRKRKTSKHMAAYVLIGLAVIWAAPFVVNLLIA